MKTALITHPDCENHELAGHPERPDRLQAVMRLLTESGLEAELNYITAAEIATSHLSRIHSPTYIEMVEQASPADGQVIGLDPDTYMSSGSLRAARLAAGACIQAVDQVMQGHADNAFCAVRPPGHHAEIAAAMGFCIFNNIATAAEYALHLDQIERVAILDFDVQHCNGTVDIFKDRDEVLVCSSFQDPFYPYRYNDYSNQHIVISPLAADDGSFEFRHAIETAWTPAIEAHKPDFVLVSAGFDAHQDDPVGQLNLTEDDYVWVSHLIRNFAASYADNRLVSTLEGGYDIKALASSTLAHITALKA
jgi:acetoin utilization deacetylase AcuC-like enzyme